MTPRHAICWVEIPVSNLERAARFYGAVFGRPLTIEMIGGSRIGLLPCAREGGVSAALTQRKENQPSKKGPLVFLNVEGRLDEAVEAAARYGGQILEPKRPSGPFAFPLIVVDSEGNRVALHSLTA